MKKIFVTEEVNTSRQIEFDIAKTLSIIIMVFVHCFENLSRFSDHLDTQPLYYAVVVVLDVLFAANLFIGSMGLGMVYSRNQEPDTFIKRGFRLFCSGYLLNVLRCTIPYSLLGCLGLMSWKVVLLSTFFDDILQYAGSHLFSLDF